MRFAAPLQPTTFFLQMDHSFTTKGKLSNFNSQFTNEDVYQRNSLDVETLALWDTGNEHTIVCSEYIDIAIPDNTIAVMSFE